MRSLLRRLLRRRTRSRVVRGGALPSPWLGTDSLPAMLSEARCTHRRWGETWAEAMDRLTEGRDL